MTEDEAKKKWCPFVRMHSSGSGAGNRDMRTPDAYFYKCIGSSCMVWRWDKLPFPDEYSDTDGHCGLVGRQS